MADGRDFDVVIVGAGAAGIAACRHLAAAKLRVVALEARNRVGGGGARWTEPPETYRHLIGRTDRTDTGNYQIRPHGWPMISCYFGGPLSMQLEKDGREAMAAFAIDELAGIYGNNIRACLSLLAGSALGAAILSLAAPIPAPCLAMRRPNRAGAACR